MMWAMRRKDLLILFALAILIIISWQKLQPPVIDDGQLTIDEAILNNFSFWHGPIDRVLAHSGTNNSDDQAKVLGATTIVEPSSTLPIEHYYGQPGIFSLEAMLSELSVKVNPEDIVKVFPDPTWGIGSKITVYRATPFELVDWGKSRHLRTWKQTIEEILIEQSVELGDNDRIVPKIGEKISNNGRVEVIRVAITEVKIKEKIEFKQLEREDPELPRGEKKVTKGSLGERTKTFKVTRENGVEIKRELLKNEVTLEPVNQLTVIGTKVLIGRSYTGPASWYKYDSTKVASDLYKRGTKLRITNLDNNKQIFVTNDGCICSDTAYVVDLHPDHFTALGGKLSAGVMKKIRVEEILN